MSALLCSQTSKASSKENLAQRRFPKQGVAADANEPAGTMARPMTGMAMPPPQTGMRTAVGTSAGAGGAFLAGTIREGRYTEQIYGMVRDGKWSVAIEVLSAKLLEFPSSRSAASLLAYCYYHSGDYQNALQTYERLMRMCAGVSPMFAHLTAAEPRERAHSTASAGDTRAGRRTASCQVRVLTADHSPLAAAAQVPRGARVQALLRAITVQGRPVRASHKGVSEH